MFGVPVRIAQEMISLREFQQWMVYFDIDFETPSRTDWYLMQVAKEVASVLSKNPGDIKIESFRLGRQKEVPQEKKAEMSKAFWLGMGKGARNGRRDRGSQASR